MLILQVEQKTAELQRLVLPEFEPIQVTILQGVKDLNRTQKDEIILSEDVLLSSNELQRAIIKLWLRKNLGLVEMQRSVLEESMVDLVLFIHGYYQPIDKLSGAWPTSLLTMSGTTLFENLQQMISYVLIQSYLDLPTLERYQFSRELLTNVKAMVAQNQQRVHKENEIFAEKLESIEQAMQQLKLIMQYLQDLPSIGERSLGKLKNLEQLNNSEENSLLVDYVFEIQVAKANQEVEYANFVKAVGSSAVIGNIIAVVKEKQLGVLNSKGELIYFPATQIVKAHQYVLLDCEIPDYARIQELQKRARKLLYVRNCQDRKQIHFSRFFREGVEGFAKENLSAAFMQIHLASLKEVWNEEKSNPLVALSQSQFEGDFFIRTGWKKPIWVESLQAYRSQSIVQSIDVFRN